MDSVIWRDVIASGFGEEKTFSVIVNEPLTSITVFCNEDSSLRITVNIPLNFCLSELKPAPRRYVEPLFSPEEEELLACLSPKSQKLHSNYKILWQTPASPN